MIMKKNMNECFVEILNLHPSSLLIRLYGHTIYLLLFFYFTKVKSHHYHTILVLRKVVNVLYNFRLMKKML